MISVRTGMVYFQNLISVWSYKKTFLIYLQEADLDNCESASCYVYYENKIVTLSAWDSVTIWR